MNKAAVALATITISVASAFAGAFAYLTLANLTLFELSASTASLSTTPNQKTNPPTSSRQTAQPPSNITLNATAPAPLDDPAYPEGLSDWLPLGTFGLRSPLNQTYTVNTLAVSVGGVVIAGDPYFSYSLDGAPCKPIPVELKKPEGLDFTMQRQISASVVLPPLANGLHVIVLFADLGVEGRKGKETIYFDVETA